MRTSFDPPPDPPFDSPVERRPSPRRREEARAAARGEIVVPPLAVSTATTATATRTTMPPRARSRRPCLLRCSARLLSKPETVTGAYPERRTGTRAPGGDRPRVSGVRALEPVRGGSSARTPAFAELSPPRGGQLGKRPPEASRPRLEHRPDRGADRSATATPANCRGSDGHAGQPGSRV